MGLCLAKGLPCRWNQVLSAAEDPSPWGWSIQPWGRRNFLSMRRAISSPMARTRFLSGRHGRAQVRRPPRKPYCFYRVLAGRQSWPSRACLGVHGYSVARRFGLNDGRSAIAFMIAGCYLSSMNMRTFISLFPDQLEVVAETAGTKPIYLRQIANGHRQPSFSMAMAYPKPLPPAPSANPNCGPTFGRTKGTQTAQLPSIMPTPWALQSSSRPFPGAFMPAWRISCAGW